MNTKPKPATGEWTGDDDGVLLPMHRFVGQYAKEIAGARNAALAAERQKLEVAERSAKQWQQDAERYCTNTENAARVVKQLRAQQQPLVDALKWALTNRMSGDYYETIQAAINAALAKVGK